MLHDEGEKMTGHTHRGYELAHTGAVIFDFSSQGTITAIGTEAVPFLHNLTTNDIKSLAPDTGCEAFVCNHTARILAHVFVFRDQPEGKKEQFWLVLPSGDVAKVFAHLDRHLISEDVALADCTEDMVWFHVGGATAADVLRAAGVDAAELLPWQQRISGKYCVRRTDFLSLPGYDVFTAKENGPSLWESLGRHGATPAPSGTFELLRIEAGFPLYGVDMTDQTFVVEVGRVQQGISYNKGCYLGQEPIVMARDRGQVNRGLFGLKLEGGPVPAGSLLFREGKDVGRVTSSVFSPLVGSGIALAYVRRGNQQPGTVVEVRPPGEGPVAMAEVRALPFS
jgi:tRNA-modifying protein YgfZ